VNALLANLVAALAMLAPASAPGVPPVLPETAAPVPGCAGVWVVVDATALGKGVTTSCAHTHATGNEALQSAGFRTERTAGMLCAINGLPEVCKVAASAYWSYWQASPSGLAYGHWSYAGVGPGSYRPRGGDAEGWVFGDGTKPPSELPSSIATAASDQPTPAPATAEPAPSPATEPSEPAAPAGSGGLDPGRPYALIVVAGVVMVVGLGVGLVRRRGR
jgi:hypothetical protein